MVRNTNGPTEHGSRPDDPPSASPRRTLSPGERLPELDTPTVDDVQVVSWRAPTRSARLIVFLPPTAEAQRGLATLLLAVPAFRVWGVWMIVVVPDEATEAALSVRLPADVRLVRDPGDRARARCGIAAREAAVIVADRYGEVYHVARARDLDGLPATEEIEEWLRFLATQCPECGVPDQALEGEWTWK